MTIDERKSQQTHAGDSQTPRTEQVPLLTVDDVARILRLSKEAVYRMTWQGVLPTVRLGPGSVRIDPRDLEEFLAARRP
jgi:excisionase family DNA binding protein